MKIYKVTRTDKVSYTDYEAFICVAPDMEWAKELIPHHNYKGELETYLQEDLDADFVIGGWTNDKNNLKVELLGIADATFDKTKILLASFNA